MMVWRALKTTGVQMGFAQEHDSRAARAKSATMTRAAWNRDTV